MMFLFVIVEMRVRSSIHRAESRMSGGLNGKFGDARCGVESERLRLILVFLIRLFKTCSETKFAYDEMLMMSSVILPGFEYVITVSKTLSREPRFPTDEVPSLQ